MIFTYGAWRINAMARITLRITGCRCSALLLALALILLLYGSAVPKRSATAQSAAAVVSSPGGVGYYYLTKTYASPIQALEACGSGYHMASMWEIYDPSNLVYASNHPNASSWTDSGFGPPSEAYGWVRSGYISSGDPVLGKGNCDNWTSTTSGDYGTAAGLSNRWDTNPGLIGPWLLESAACSTSIGRRVWCVSGQPKIYLPTIFHNN